ncbi:polysaccharide deacetylase family protein [Caldibacillus lycopersici]|uniref:Polysaccharide deacetylase family protein n=1 Tax=Perspicuibacillus lycopersici TaxID=1325689 RepID=A0AAE3LLS3_9BACI|nr:polysaccharide deacetylase family protein [Perspicuibacillus lycopersici]MCU9612057.1 polysaccharide deacetylase family protein [Perspicuibacillus lycopersici]
MRKYSYQRISTLLMIALFAFLLVENPFSDAYVGKLKSDAMEVSSSKDSLYVEIEQKAKDYEKAASDAKIDKVWKKMPGYNGLQVDIDASYEKMKETGVFDEELFVYKQIPPKVHLEDLEAAPIYRGHPEKPMVSLTINVAWGNEYLSAMLATLKEQHVYATFFIEGRWAKQNPDLVKMIYEGGHEIGNHSFSHPNMQKLNTAQVKKELADTNDILQATTGKIPTLFAPPSGSFRDEVVQIADNMNMETILWSVDTIDWQKPSSSVIINRVLKQVHNGAIILMHPTESTANALEKLITDIKNKGYQLGTVSDLLDEKRIKNDEPF